MITISLCMIVKNEEDTLERCLSCVEGIADEIVIVDTGSSDRTKEIASRFTDRIYDYEWKDDFGAARNESFSKATKEYCMWLDADDVIPEEEQKKLRCLKAGMTQQGDVVMVRYATEIDEEGKPVFFY